MTTRLPLIVFAAALAAACGNGSSTATSPTTATIPAITTVTFADTLDAGGSRFYSFSNNTAGSVTAFLASVTASGNPLPLAIPLELGIGVPAGTGCATTMTQVVTPGLVTELTDSLAAGVFCLRVADAGALKAPVTFAVRFNHP